MDLDDLGFERGFRGFAAYGRSKFANILFTIECARQLTGTGTTVNALHPGLVATNLGASMPLPMRIGFTLMRPFMLSAEAGAKTSLYVAMSPAVDGVTGRYFGRRGEEVADPLATDPELAQVLWQRSAAMTGLD